jgi:hypothetical protein
MELTGSHKEDIVGGHRYNLSIARDDPLASDDEDQLDPVVHVLIGATTGGYLDEAERQLLDRVTVRGQKDLDVSSEWGGDLDPCLVRSMGDFHAYSFPS